MAKTCRLTQLEKQTVVRHFAMKWSTSARVNFYLLESQTRACSLWESVILRLPPPTCKAYPIALLLHDHCAIYPPPPTDPSCLCYTLYNIGDGNIV